MISKVEGRWCKNLLSAKNFCSYKFFPLCKCNITFRYFSLFFKKSKSELLFINDTPYKTDVACAFPKK